jgi:hypothetical protein
MEPVVFSETPSEVISCFFCSADLTSDGLCSPVDTFRGYPCCPDHQADAINEVRKWLHDKGFVSPLHLQTDVLKDALETPVTVTRESGEVENDWALAIIRNNDGIISYKNYPSRHEDGKWSMCMRKGNIGVRNYIPEDMTNIIQALDEQWAMCG